MKLKIGTILQAYGFPMISGFKGENFYKVVELKDGKALFRRCNELGDVGNLALGTFSADIKTVNDAIKSVEGGISTNGLKIWKESILREFITTDKTDAALKVLKNKLSKEYPSIEAVNVISGTPKEFAVIFTGKPDADKFSKKWPSQSKGKYKFEKTSVESYGGEKYYYVKFMKKDESANLDETNNTFKLRDRVLVDNKPGKIIAFPTTQNPKYGKIALVKFDHGGTKEIDLSKIKQESIKDTNVNPWDNASVGKLQNQYARVLAEISKQLENYKKEKGTSKATSIVAKLKALNAEKKQLESKLDAKVSGLYKDAGLKAESVLRKMIKRLISEQLSTLSEMGMNDAVSKRIIRLYQSGTPSQKRFISLTLTAKPTSSEKEIEKGLRDLNSQEVIQMAKKLHID